ncbi:alpha subunit of phenylalanyl-tRNA synthetase [Ochromonadaceae sp. CCMP2298]|nr:alpha subunit of phenylalanyl-tRNA synthetase [Ochromonadaceae sp. CCMP2298]
MAKQEKADSDGVAPPTKSLEELMVEAKQLEEAAIDSLNSATGTKEIEALRVAYLGKNGKITNMMKLMRALSKEDKPKLGEVVNKAVKLVEGAIEVAKFSAAEREFNEKIDREDLGNLMRIHSIPGFTKKPGTRHPISLVMDLTTRIFEDIGYEVVSGPKDSPEIENDFYNFEALGMPFSHSARDMQDTLYINTSHSGTDDVLLLRTHTSAVQIREMEKRTPPFKICAPGRVYRRDAVDATHYPVFHQVEILAMDEIGKLTLPHLLGTVKHFLQKMFGDEIEVKYRASYFPFTEPSIEVDVFFKGKWLEVLGCGMVDPVVLESVGYDTTKYGGFAAGFGIERFAMIMHNITDIRDFWENHPQFLSQFPSVQYSIPGEDDEDELAFPDEVDDENEYF